MVLENYRHILDVYFDPMARFFKNVHPNVFTFLSILFALAGGIAYAFAGEVVPHTGDHRYPFLLIAGMLLVALNAIADTLDGRIARMHGKSSRVGDFLDHTIDRLSDVAILVGMSVSIYSNTIFGLVSVITVILASYMGTQSQAVGAGRDYSGVMGRAERMFLLFVLTPLQFLIEVIWGVRGWDPFGLLGYRISPIELLLAAMLLGGALTFVQRGLGTYRSLHDQERAESGRPRKPRRPAGRERISGKRGL
jgi:archaetidylinositol phosphate synthase